MSGLTIYEFDALAHEGENFSNSKDVHKVPGAVFDWLDKQCLKAAEEGEGAWLRWSQRSGRRVIQVTSFVGVIRGPGGYQIEVLPKVGRAFGGGDIEARQLLIEMLSCLYGFRHVRTDSAKISATDMPLLEIFIKEFLHTVEQIVKRGLRSDYRQKQDNLFALRGKLLMASHLRQNLVRADRFFTEHDEFSTDRPENRLLHAALRRVLVLTKVQENQKLARELDFVFADIPPSTHRQIDFQQVRLDRGMGYYADALAWARLILDEESPLTGLGDNKAPSLLFPMEAVFEAFVAKHLPRQLAPPHTLKTQAQSLYLVQHQGKDWFRLKPDLLIQNPTKNLLVLDTKWKLLDSLNSNRKDKYGLSQSDFYQLQAYGLSYLDGKGDIFLIYPKTDTFQQPLPVFEFPKISALRLWVLPFCLKTRCLLLPSSNQFERVFVKTNCTQPQSSSSASAVATPAAPANALLSAFA